MTITLNTDFGKGGSGVTPGGSSGSPALVDVLRGLVTDILAVQGGGAATTKVVGSATTESTGTAVTGSATSSYTATEQGMLNDLEAAVNQNILLLAELKAGYDKNVDLLTELKASNDGLVGASLTVVNG